MSDLCSLDVENFQSFAVSVSQNPLVCKRYCNADLISVNLAIDAQVSDVAHGTPVIK